MDNHDQWLADFNDALRQETEVVDATRYTQSESKYLSAKDFVGKNLKVTISDVGEQHFEADDTKPARDLLTLSFKGKDKGLCLNATNATILVEAYGGETDGWAGHEVGLSTADYTAKGFGHGWVIRALDVKEVEFNDEIPF